MKSCDSIAELAGELGVHRSVLYDWRDQLAPLYRTEWQKAEEAGESPLARENRLLKQALGEKTLEVDFFKGALQKSGLEAREQQAWRDGIYDQIRELMSEQGKLSIERMCQLAGVSRAGFYRWLQRQEPVEEELEVRSVIQQIIVEHKRRYGYRRVSAELRRRGLAVNHKRVARLMREDNLLAVQPKSFVITTDSEHALEVYLNLAKRMKLSGLNQLWIADITYIRLQREFVFSGGDSG